MLRCGALCGLVLLFAAPAPADELLRATLQRKLRDENYMLVEDQDGARLYVFSTGNVSAVIPPDQESTLSTALHRKSMVAALDMTRSATSRTRVRGLTLLSGIDDPAALNAALVLLSDPDVAVREEAVQLMIEHPDADIDAIVAIATNDPSARVQQALADLIEERLDDRGD